MKQSILVTITFGVICFLACESAELAHVTELGIQNFDRLVVESDHVWVVEFYSPRCGTCQEMAPIWERVSKGLQKEFLFGSVNIDLEEGMKLAEKLDIFNEGIPNIQVYGKDDPKTVFSGYEVPSPKKLTTDILAAVKGLSKGRDGKYIT
ncbi:hypothetical protein CYMTET_3700 [Cymbomonas tetramitiformis]|uniref:Thioredoxin domain-containing protein n=1 Tax=Cymbomonas tetramitiformis TaxID=36881 RepID=A0AAE0H2Y0_9CHLO|nr:hypothetical protein CYMTET_3700 [Cymbomonas tetramitiformis]